MVLNFITSKSNVQYRELYFIVIIVVATGYTLSGNSAVLFIVRSETIIISVHKKKLERQRNEQIPN